MSGPAFALLVLLLGVIILLGIRLLIAAANLATLTDARDALAEDHAALTVKVGQLEREIENWRDSDRIRRRGIHPTVKFPEA